MTCQTSGLVGNQFQKCRSGRGSIIHTFNKMYISSDNNMLFWIDSNLLPTDYPASEASHNICHIS